MEKPTVQRSQIVHYCYSATNKEGEHFIAEHALSYLLAGSQEFYADDGKHLFKAGDIRLFAKDQLGRFVKIPPNGEQFVVITVRLDRDTLLSMSAELQFSSKATYNGSRVLQLPRAPLLLNFFQSLKPYYETMQPASNALQNMKIREAIMILLEVQPSLQNLLFDFRSPRKMDLEPFMQRNYRYNVNIDRFAYLTGRSLATFKRDFQKAFGMPPHAWLMQQRLHKAHEMLLSQGLSAWDVFEDVGFKDYTHFSFAFKKAFGYPPSAVKTLHS
ncbi:AraC family transcriptional regulator [Chitinophaga filiformis]|uniref:helix-turn-helix domain-containing protein n=1 Tax=Chitinophaga filiformis TaxID=104663 RepID=UPI001F21F198|nr:AraC family transcriptional regulator [Chitinophaga filiformis]MCF6402950.1 AraC family transcriptional regulator [Chitinophaga filiformis]